MQVLSKLGSLTPKISLKLIYIKYYKYFLELLLKEIQNLKVAIFDQNMVVVKSKYLVTLYLYKLTQPSDPLILGGPLILVLVKNLTVFVYIPLLETWQPKLPHIISDMQFTDRGHKEEKWKFSRQIMLLWCSL